MKATHSVLLSQVVKYHICLLCDVMFIYFYSEGARPKITKRNSMDSVELWKYPSDKVK